MRRRACFVLAATALLTACGGKQPTETGDGAPSEVVFDRVYGSDHAVNEEFRIDAQFVAGKTVCLSDSGTHIHGFHQLLDGDCSVEAERKSRFISVYADYNAAFYSWKRAEELYCGSETEPFAIGVAATGEGRLLACRPKGRGDADVLTVVYLAEGQDPDSLIEGDEEGPGMMYSITLGTTKVSEAADLATFREFFSKLRLAGSSFALEPNLLAAPAASAPAG